MRAPRWEVIVSDVRDALRAMPAGHFHCAVTSFPYWQLRDYEGDDRQIGLEPTFAEFVRTCVDVSREIRRVLRKDGTFWLNMGKSYAGARSFQGDDEDTDGVFSRRAARLGSLSGSSVPKEGDDAFARRDVRQRGLGHRRDPAFKDQDLVMQGHLLAEALRQDGWWLRSDNVWHKNAMPESATTRPANTHENVFILTPSKDCFFDMEAVRTETKDPKRTGHVFGGAQRVLIDPAGSQGEDTLRRTGNTYEASSGANLRTVWSDEPSVNEFMESLWEEFLDYAAERLGIGTDVWKIGNEPFPLEHFAVFSTKLVERCVKAGTSEKGCCPECGTSWQRTVTKGEPDREHQIACGSDADGNYDGESTKNHGKAGVQDASAVKARILAGMRKRISTWSPGCECPGAVNPVPCRVLDPFTGSGRTGKASIALGRDFTGIELIDKYAAMARANIADPEWESRERARIRREKKEALRAELRARGEEPAEEQKALF